MPTLTGLLVPLRIPFSVCTDLFKAADTIRILVATDSHVGYEERDPIRKDDSWKSFDEIMQLARTQDVSRRSATGSIPF
jgi:hypothetical protein